MKNISLFLSFILVASCASNDKKNDHKVKSKIFPVHPAPPGRATLLSEQYIHSFIDFDGNQYITEWKDPISAAYDSKKFRATTRQCSALIEAHYPKSLTKPWITDQELIFKKVAQCFLDSGYELIESSAYRPELVIVTLSKVYSSGGKTIGAGGKIIIDTKDLVMREILPKAQECFTLSNNAYSQGDAVGFIYIDMKPVIEKFEICLKEKGLIAKSSLNKK